MENEKDPRPLYSGGCLTLKDALFYLKDKPDKEGFDAENQIYLLDNHINKCKSCFDRLEKFASTYHPDDGENLVF